LFDRFHISRAQMTLKEGLEPKFNNMYRNIEGDSLETNAIYSLEPDLTIYLNTPIDTLINRLNINDPKYEFRHNNILSSNGYYEEAFEVLSKRNDNLISINGAQDPRSIEKIVIDAIIKRNILNRKDILIDDQSV